MMTLQKEVFKTSLQSLSCYQFDGIKKNLDCEIAGVAAVEKVGEGCK